MTHSQKIQIEMSEKRERLNYLSGLEGEAFTAEHRSEVDTLSKEYSNLEARFRAAIVAESEAVPPIDREGSEGKEIRELGRKASLAAFLGEAVNQTELSKSSPESELRFAILGDSAQPGQLPWAMLAPDVLEERQTDAETTIGSGVSLPNRQNQIIGRVFSASALNFLRVETTSVPTGTAAWPVLTAGTSAVQRSGGQRVDATAASFLASAIEPVRLTARYLFRLEDLSKLQGMEPALRSDLRGAVSDAMDAQIIAGDGTAPNVNGLVNALTAPVDPSNVFTWSDAVRAVASQVDGKFAATPAQVRTLVDPALYPELAVSLHATASVSAAARYIEQISGGIRVSANLPGPASDIATALISKTAQRGSVAPVWEGLSLIRDPYTEAATGRVSLTAVALWNFQVVRSEAYSLVKFKIS